MALKYKTTADLKVPKETISQVVGQEHAVKIIKKAALQRRHVLLIGEPGTGKSMLGLALAELLPKEKLQDVISLPNPDDENQPLIKTIAGGKGRELVARNKLESLGEFRFQNVLIIALAIFSMIAPWWIRSYYKSDIMFTAFFLGGMIFIVAAVLFMNMGKRFSQKVQLPKVIVDHAKHEHAPFLDATGAHAGSLLGDVLHDPFQTGGLGTPPHERVVAGMIHKANNGVLFVDEIGGLQANTQQELLTALQEGKYAITGQSERSAGAMVRTEPVPCSFILVAAGNYETISHMHPALRSRIRGYGYEVYMKDSMPDTAENQDRIAYFVAQEVKKDKKIPHFTREAVEAMIDEARKMANHKGHLTLRLRELGGLIRAAGDLAHEQKAKFVERIHVLDAKKIARTLEQQIADRSVERKKEYDVIQVQGQKVGRVNGLAVFGSTDSYSGMLMPIEAEVTPGGKEREIVATGKLGEIAKEAVKNVTAIVKKLFGHDIKENDVYVQFLQTYEGVEGDSASIAVAIAIISALKQVPVKQDYAVTGSLSVRGDVLPVGGVSSKIEAAIDAGIKHVILPKSNEQDIVVDKQKLSKIKIITVENIVQVLHEIIDWKGKESILKRISGQ
jgi:Lon-like ATP-dependent protease